MSDVDLLAVVNRTDLESASPQEALQFIAEGLRDKFGSRAEITVGDMAVTVVTNDGHEIQVLPALRTATGVRLPSAGRDGWSNVARPQQFASKLTEINQANGNQVVPVIKLFKALQDRAMPGNTRLTSYHAESIAIEAFRSYDGRLARKDMLRHFVNEAGRVVRNPMVDSTGQSRHVDDYLGGQGSFPRAQASRALSNLGRKLDAANRASDQSIWEELFRE